MGSSTMIMVSMMEQWWNSMGELSAGGFSGGKVAYYPSSTVAMPLVHWALHIMCVWVIGLILGWMVRCLCGF